MGRERKIHVQQAMVFSKRGGKRKGAGRPAKRGRASERHKTRGRVRRNEPVHVTLRLEHDVGTLRQGHTYEACRKALVTVLGRDTFRVVHISLQDRHLHMLVEAEDERCLAKGMQAFEIAAARYINQAISKRRRRKRQGRVFSDRYHARVIATPRAARTALAYVLNNWRRHREDVDIDMMFFDVDPFSSGASFLGWKQQVRRTYRREGYDREALPEELGQSLPVSRAQTWLLDVGWTSHGLISVQEIPGPRSSRLVA